MIDWQPIIDGQYDDYDVFLGTDPRGHELDLAIEEQQWLDLLAEKAPIQWWG